MPYLSQKQSALSGVEAEINEIFSHNNFENNRRFTGDYSPVPLSRLLEKLGNPQLTYKTIHIAGTNAKGSMTYYLYRMLKAEGYYCSAYLSPHLLHFHERFEFSDSKQNNFLLKEQLLLEAWQKIKKNDLSKLSWFDIVTAVAFESFRIAGIRWAVIETGLGGRQDSTNNLKPEFVVLTPIALDHTNILGKTIPEIAFEKAGIIKKDIPVYALNQSNNALNVINNQAKLLNAALKKVPDSAEWKDYRQINLNAAEYIFKDFYNIKAPHCDLEIPGRLETIHQNPVIYYDAGHNQNAASKLAEFAESKEGSWNIYCNCLSERLLEDLLFPFALLNSRLKNKYLYLPENLPPGLHQNSDNFRISENISSHLHEADNHLIFGSFRLYSHVKYERYII